ncbi:MAG: hypothetical protein ACN6PW_02845 [Pseudomonas kermanshahensis]|uniref:hypothetical protein n=1 Tax=Pseudomonas kermanshahensis TaxID=2745482 RepID=UPI003D0F0A6D
MPKQFQPYEASPQVTGATANEALYVDLTSAAHVTDIAADTQCKLQPGCRLINVKDIICSSWDQIEIALVNDVQRSVIYYSKVIITNLPYRGTARSYVWRSPCAEHATMLREVAYKVPFNYLIRKYHLIISDSHRNGEGRFEWHRKMSYAIHYNLNAHYYNRRISRLISIRTQDELNILTNQLWTSSNDEEPNLAIISTKPVYLDLIVASISSHDF